MTDATSWTTSADLREKVLHMWERGKFLSAGITGETLFPLPLSMRCPEPKAKSFGAVCDWIRELKDNSRSRKGFGYEIEWVDKNYREIGPNSLPKRALVPTESDALRLIDKEKEGRRFRELAEVTIGRFPTLAQWVSSRPFELLKHEKDWSRMLDVLAWFRDHPRAGLYLRQLAIPGVDSKFVEDRVQLFFQLLDVVLEPHDGPLTGRMAQKFAQRCGLRTEPSLIRFRALDSRIAIAGLSDLTIPASDFATLNIAARHIFITENKMNCLAFPDFPEAIVVFGKGVAAGLLHSASWMSERHIYYWGDIDTHGFDILDRLRARFPNLRSCLMNRETLLAHRSLWVREEAPCRTPLLRLDQDEQALFDDLVHDRLDEKVRLEQERISPTWWKKNLEAIKRLTRERMACLWAAPHCPPAQHDDESQKSLE